MTALIWTLNIADVLCGDGVFSFLEGSSVYTDAGQSIFTEPTRPHRTVSTEARRRKKKHRWLSVASAQADKKRESISC